MVYLGKKPVLLKTFSLWRIPWLKDAQYNFISFKKRFYCYYGYKKKHYQYQAEIYTKIMLICKKCCGRELYRFDTICRTTLLFYTKIRHVLLFRVGNCDYQAKF